MSTLLESLLDPKRREQCAANETPPLREFVIRIKHGAVTRLTFTAMAVDSLAAAVQHECLCETGEYVSAMPAARYRGPFAADDRRALERQVDAQRRDPILGGVY